jgi:hypothetical protein
VNKTSLYLECVLTEEEIADRQHGLMESTISKCKAESELVGETAAWAAKKKELEGKISSHATACRTLANAIKTEREMRNVDCIIEIHPPHHLMIRCDTGEVVRTRAATTDELQMALPGIEPPTVRCLCNGGPEAEVKYSGCPIHGVEAPATTAPTKDVDALPAGTEDRA